MQDGQPSVSHLPLLTEEFVSTGLGSMSDGPDSNCVELCSQMRADFPLTTMMDFQESGGDQERDLQTPVLQIMTVMGGSIMVWGGITCGNRTHLYVVPEGAITGVRSRDEILEPTLVPFAKKCGRKRHFQGRQ